jgi:DNA modification methylase
MKQLYFGDCLDVLRNLSEKNPNGLIDLIYIDPPFNSKRNYNILFEDMDMSDTKAQREAFADTWSNVSYKDTLGELADLNYNLYELLLTLDKINTSSSSVAYLTTMAIRIYYIHRVLKDTGSFYLHCDQNMSHYLKLICDIIFNDNNTRKYFKNEIIWKRNFTKKGSQYKMNRYAINTDIILYYAKSQDYFYETPLTQLPESELLKKYSRVDDQGRRFKSEPIELPKIMARPNLVYEYKGYKPLYGWMMEREKLEDFDNNDKLFFTKNGKPRRKNFLKDYPGTEVDNLWVDIQPLGQKQVESLGYPTQKPVALLERIIKASSNEGDLVADFFCGCGTTIAAANKLNRNWIGADISHLAIRLILKRLTDPIKDEGKKKFLSDIEINGFPKDVDSAKQLAKSDKLLEKKSKHGAFDFQHWVVEFMLGGIRNPKEIADGGWDGYITFPKNNNEKGRVLIEVKSGKVNVKNMREFINVIDKEAADIGVFVCFEDSVTKPMQIAAKEAGQYKPYKFDRIQIITIEDLFDEREIKMPGGVDPSVFKSATQESRPEYKDPNLFE